jgi:hypothetical protein
LKLFFTGLEDPQGIGYDTVGEVDYGELENNTDALYDSYKRFHLLPKLHFRSNYIDKKYSSELFKADL